jgi:uncharacterized protein YbjT (DUF2867 family)
MKIIITGSLGNISRPLAQKLIAAGHTVGVVSSKPDKAAKIEALGASALIGSVEDGQFITAAFKGADAVYTMIPPDFSMADYNAFSAKVAGNYSAAIQEHGIQYVVNLSSIVTPLSGAAPLENFFNLEEELNKVEGLNVVHLRPAMFYTNFYGQLHHVKERGMIGHNVPPSVNMLLTHPADIADAAFRYLDGLSFRGINTFHIISDVKNGNQIAATIGSAIGNPQVQWVFFPDDQLLEGLMQNGFSKDAAQAYVIDAGMAIRENLLNDYYQANGLDINGNRSFGHFMKEVFNA